VPLAPGLLLAERFRIVRFLGQGGMGDVYEAQDLEVGEPVALKMLRAEIAQDERAIERFRSELALARRVTHRNVCRIFDVFRHRPATEDAGRELALISMEMLPGETLAERIHRGGPLPAREALPIVKQMAAALDAAHRAGVIHRDFKSSNVILVPTGAAGQPPRAVVTDFGLAQGIAAREAASAGESQPTEVLGTPAYMAPEQVSGGAITPSADIYALGVVMYEMATGSCPFQADTPHVTALKRLSDPVISPRMKVPGLDPRWEAVILRCLEREPGQRYPTAGDLLADLEPPAPRAATSRAALLAAGAVVAILVGLVLFLASRPKAPPRITANAQVTTSAGLDLYPAFSPDGRAVAFASDRTGAFEIYTRALADPPGRETALTRDGEQNFQPAWSPDGSRIAYHSKGRGGLWIVDVKGGPPARFNAFGSRPAWSPDGGRIAFQSSALVDFAANAVPAAAPSTIWIASVSGGEPRRITDVGKPAGAHGSPSWTADGRGIVFGSYDRLAASVWSVPASGGEPLEVVRRQRYVYDPVCSPQGDAVYYAALLPGGSYGIWRAELAASGRSEGEPVPLGSIGGGIARHPAVTGDGRRIAYSALTLVSNLWVAPLARDGHGTTGPSRALTTGTARANRPAFSPDGTRIAFDRWQPGTNPDVWVMDRAGHGAAPVTSDPGVDTTPNWTPEGDRIVFLTTRSGTAEAWTVGADGKGEKRLASFSQDVQFLRLAPNGKRIAFDAKGERGGTRIWISGADGSDAQPLTAEQDALAYPIWSPDGSRLAAQGRREDDVDIVVLPVTKEGPPQRVTSETGQSWASGWSRDGKDVIFAALRDGFWSIRSVTVDSGEVRALVSEERLGAYLRYPTISPEGDQLVYERAETTGNVWMMELGR
jgi:Tol biopolymer transport system component